MQNLYLADIGWIVLGLILYLFATSSMPAALFRWVSACLGRTPHYVMSRPRLASQNRSHTAVYIPVSHTDMKSSGMDVSERAVPDIDASNAGMPRVSRDITIDEEIVLLAVLRAPDGSYRHTANKIYQFVGGDRNSVLNKVREVRATPVYRPLTPDHRPAELQQV